MFDRPESGERAVLVHLTLRSRQEDILELKELAKSAGTDPVYVVTGSRKKPDPKFFVGKGKLEELKGIIETYEADIVLFNHPLSPSQERNLEGHLGVRVVDRNGLILASFAIPYIAYISTLHIRNDRTILIALPILFILAADLLYTTWQQISSLRIKRLAQFALVVFACSSIAYLSLQTAVQNTKQVTPNATEYARQWIEANISSETRIAAEVYSPFIDPLQHKVTYVTWLISNTPEWYVQQGYDLLVLSSRAYARYYAMPAEYPIEIAEYDALLSRFKEVTRFNQNGVTIKILSVKP